MHKFQQFTLVICFEDFLGEKDLRSWVRFFRTCKQAQAQIQTLPTWSNVIVPLQRVPASKNHLYHHVESIDMQTYKPKLLTLKSAAVRALLHNEEKEVKQPCLNSFKTLCIFRHPCSSSSKKVIHGVNFALFPNLERLELKNLCLPMDMEHDRLGLLVCERLHTLILNCAVSEKQVLVFPQTLTHLSTQISYSSTAVFACILRHCSQLSTLKVAVDAFCTLDFTKCKLNNTTNLTKLRVHPCNTMSGLVDFVEFRCPKLLALVVDASYFRTIHLKSNTLESVSMVNYNGFEFSLDHLPSIRHLAVDIIRSRYVFDFSHASQPMLLDSGLFTSERCSYLKELNTSHLPQTVGAFPNLRKLHLIPETLLKLCQTKFLLCQNLDCIEIDLRSVNPTIENSFSWQWLFTDLLCGDKNRKCLKRLELQTHSWSAYEAEEFASLAFKYTEHVEKIWKRRLIFNFHTPHTIEVKTEAM